MDRTQIGQLWVRWCDVAHLKFRWLVLPVYGVVCSELDEAGFVREF